MGGISWHSSIVYYRLLNELAQEHGGFHSADMILRSLNMQSFVDLQAAGSLKLLQASMIQELESLAMAGANIFAIASNTGHLYAPEVLPQGFLSIYDALAAEIKRHTFKKIGLFGTKYVMTGGDYAQNLKKRGISCLQAPKSMTKQVSAKVYNELAKGVYSEQTRNLFLQCIDEYAQLGADAVILGCTEIPELLAECPTRIPTIDSVEVHVRAIWQAACGTQ